MARARRGDAEAFAALVEPYQKRLYNLTFRMTGRRDEAADMVQDALLRAYTSLAGYRAQAAFGTWLHRIAANVCLDALRRRKRRPEGAGGGARSLNADREVAAGEAGEGSAGGGLAGAGGAGEDPSPAWERRQLIQEAIAALPPDLRAAVVLRDVQGFAYEEIAVILGLSLENVKSRLHRGRLALRRRFIELELLPSVIAREPQRGELGVKVSPEVDSLPSPTVLGSEAACATPQATGVCTEAKPSVEGRAAGK